MVKKKTPSTFAISNDDDDNRDTVFIEAATLGRAKTILQNREKKTWKKNHRIAGMTSKLTVTSIFGMT